MVSLRMLLWHCYFCSAIFRKENDEGLDMKNIEDGSEAAWVPLGLKLRLSPADSTLCVENIDDDVSVDWYPLWKTVQMYHRLSLKNKFMVCK